jgi:uncharacterized protein YjiS (DUF1127 family)
MICRFVKKYRNWTKKKADIAALEALTDRDLADIGVRRWDIEAAVTRGLARDRD